MDYEALLKREQLAKKICAQLNNFVDLKNTLAVIIKQLKEISGVEAISIRLFDEGDYPYYVSEGFPKSFLKAENSILSKQNIPQGNQVSLDCMCGKVISGNVDKLKDYYTNKGSYWTNCSTDMHETLLEQEKDVNVRNHCNVCGYESVGLFPIKNRDKNIGLIQLNDKKRDVFTNDIIEFMEMIGEQIGIAVENSLLYDKLKNNNTELKSALNKLNSMQDQLMEAQKMSALADMVSSVTHEIYGPVSEAYRATAAALNVSYELAEKDTGYSNEINALSIDNKKSLKILEEVQELIRSFKVIAIDQFQESRQLINISSFISDVIKVITPSLKGVDVNFSVEGNEKTEIMCYSGALSQILSQLIKNSYQHGFRDRASGDIYIEFRISHSDSIELVYHDNGAGLENDTQHKIFEPFFSTDRKNHSGLGLTIVENLVQNKLQGSVEVSTAVDDGVEFRIRFPY
jgi:signal transduction histidine kinase